MLASVERLSRTLADSTASSSDLAPSVDTAFSPDTQHRAILGREPCARRGVCFLVSLGFDLPFFVCYPRSIVAVDRTRGRRERGTERPAGVGAPTSFRRGRRGPGPPLQQGRRFGICDMSAVAGGRMFSTRLTTAASAARERESGRVGARFSPAVLVLLNCIRAWRKAIRGGGGRPGCFACVCVLLERLAGCSGGVLMRARSGPIRFLPKTLASLRGCTNRGGGCWHLSTSLAPMEMRERESGVLR